jgi:tRNA uridine 5-carbamoylmethylation protein Kti12
MNSYLFDETVKYYEIIYGHSSGYREYEFNIKKNRKFFENLLKRLYKKYGASLGDQLIWDYLTFQVMVYSDLKTKFGKGKFPVSVIVGEKAIKRWDNKSDGWLHECNLFRKKLGIIRPVKEINTLKSISHKKYKERERKRFYNTDRGLLHCFELKLFENFSKECINCKNRGDCKKL